MRWPWVVLTAWAAAAVGLVFGGVCSSFCRRATAMDDQRNRDLRSLAARRN